MSLELQSLILLRGMCFLLAFGVEIAPAMGIVAGLGLIFFVNQPMDYFARAAFDIMNSLRASHIHFLVLRAGKEKREARSPSPCPSPPGRGDTTGTSHEPPRAFSRDFGLGPSHSRISTLRQRWMTVPLSPGALPLN